MGTNHTKLPNPLGKNVIGTISYLGGVMSLPEPFVDSWTKMIQYNYEYALNQGELIKYDRATVSYHSFARNSLVENMQGDWLLQLDTDVTFEPDILCRMLNYLTNAVVNGGSVDVLCGLYLYKNSPHPPVAYAWDPKKKEKFILGDFQKDSELIQLKSAGAGCLLVRKSVFDRMRAELKCSPFDIYFDNKMPLSEDHSFFERCWNLKIPVYASPNIWVNHLKYKELTEKDYDRTGLNIEWVDNFKL